MNKELLQAIKDYQEDFDKEYDDMKWLKHFIELVEYEKIYKDFEVPYSSKQFKSLAYWLKYQQYAYDSGTLNAKKARLLQLIGLKKNTNTKKPDKVKPKIKTDAIPIHKTKIGPKKDSGILVIRKTENKTPKSIEKKSKTTQWDITWERRFKQLVDFKEKFGHTHVCSSYTDNKQFLNFVRRIRYIKDSLPKDRVEKLNTIGFLWRPGLEKEKWTNPGWFKNYEKLKTFKKKYGHCHVPSNNKRLNLWVYEQISDKSLSEKQKRLLEELDLFENKRINVWHRKVDQLIEFQKKNGHLYVTRSKDPQLASFVKHLRKIKDKLSAEQIRRLDEIGFIWIPGKTASKLLVSEAKWLEHYAKLKLFKEQFGHCCVPRKKHRSLKNWVENQKHNKTLPMKQFMLLTEIGFFEDYGKLNLETTLAKLLDYKKKFGHLNVSRYLTNDNRLLNTIKKIRRNKSQLSAEQIKMLKRIGFKWKKEKDSTWYKYYQELKEYKQLQGSFYISKAHENKALCNWIRRQVRANLLSEEKRKLLNKIGFFRYFKST